MKLKIGIAAAAAALVTAAAWATTYEYDALGRIKKATFDDGATIDYSYDEGDNRTAVFVVNAAGDTPMTDGLVVVPLNGFTVIPVKVPYEP